MRDRLRPGAFKPDLRGERLLAEVQTLEATGGLVPLDGALVGDASEIGAVLRAHSLACSCSGGISARGLAADHPPTGRSRLNGHRAAPVLST